MNHVDRPHERNFCGGAFPDWLEVCLTAKCNARCGWCIERKGWHPRRAASWRKICAAALAACPRGNIILLGGEPTLHPDLAKIIGCLRSNLARPWITTNGSLLTVDWVERNLQGIWGVNISIHHYNLDRNSLITGLKINENELHAAVYMLLHMEVRVRLNCNCIQGQIDSVEGIRRYISWAKGLGVHSVRFAELKGAEGQFVDLARLLNYKYGLNDNPFKEGCNSDAVVDGLPVNFRQMCGLQTRLRPCPLNPRGAEKRVLYYDGKLYRGWQTKKEKTVAKKRTTYQVLEDLKAGKITLEAAQREIEDLTNERVFDAEERGRRDAQCGGGCQY